ncbi:MULTISPECIES: AraC family ligand binding domain-containing protein [unclassified Rhizobium]
MRQPNPNVIKMWSSPALDSTLFLRAHFKTHHFDRHFHQEFAIGIIQAGCQVFVYDNARRLDMPRGAVCLISPGIVHEGWPSDEQGWSYRMFYPSSEMVSRAAIDIFGRDGVTFVKPVVDDPQLFGQILAFHQAAEDPDYQSLELESLYLEVMKTALASHGHQAEVTGSTSSSFALTRAREMLEANYEDDVTLTQLGGVAELSKFHLLRQFKASFGLPPHAYLVQVRLQHARELILKGEGLADTAALVGFSDQAHMTRAFARSFGYTPGAVAASRL